MHILIYGLNYAPEPTGTGKYTGELAACRSTHSGSWIPLTNMLKAGVFGTLLYRIEGFLLWHATRVSTITESMRARIVDKGTPAASTWLFPNWADIAEIRPGLCDNAFRRALGAPDDTFVVLYAGNMGEKQGLEAVLHGADACRDDTRLLFLLVGAGGARSRLERRAAELALPNLRFMPLQPLESLGEMLAASDIHLVVQRRDAADLVMPSKLTNILAAGRACVATADAGTALHEVVHGYDAGEVVTPGDDAALTAAVRRLADDGARREACGLRARAYAERFLDKQRILSTFENQLKTLCKRA